MATGSRYDNSDLSRAVNDGQSLLQSDDAAGQAYRRSYYDTNDSYYGGYYGGGYYGGGYYGLGI